MRVHMKQKTIKATYMRGGTSKGLFFNGKDLPADKSAWDAIFLKANGSPDPYGKQVDGLGGATSSTSKAVVVTPSERPDCDVDYLFGAVSIENAVVDYSGNCGNLTSAVGPFAIHQGMIESIPSNGSIEVAIWQVNINKRIIAHVPIVDGEVQECGTFELDGVTFPSAEIILDFMDPADADGGLFPTGNVVDTLDVPGVGEIQVTLINAGNPHVFIAADSLGLDECSNPNQINGDSSKLARLEAIRAHAAVKMGLSTTSEEATQFRPHTPKLAFFGDAKSYLCDSGKSLTSNDSDITARILSMGKMHHAMTGTGGVGIASAASIEGTIVNTIVKRNNADLSSLRIAHPSGIMSVGASSSFQNNEWNVEKVSMSRTARRLMDGVVFI